MVSVLNVTLAKYKYVIKINYDKLTDEWSKKLCHGSHECARGVGEAKQYEKALK